MCKQHTHTHINTDKVLKTGVHSVSDDWPTSNALQYVFAMAVHLTFGRVRGSVLGRKIDNEVSSPVAFLKEALDLADRVPPQVRQLHVRQQQSQNGKRMKQVRGEKRNKEKKKWQERQNTTNGKGKEIDGYECRLRGA